jgi:outer membrane protein assembly factor BamB
VYNNSRIFVGDNRGIVYGLTTDFFQNVWQTMLEAPVIGKPEVIGDKLFVFTSEPALVCFSASEQTKLWKLAGATQLLTVGNRGLYVLSEGNVLSAVSPDTGETIWSDVLPKRCQVIGDPMAPVLYLANGAGSILAVKELD